MGRPRLYTDEERREKKRESVRKWRESNPNKKKEMDRKWRENNPQYARKWREDNRERLNEYYEANREKSCERARQWRQDNRENALKKDREYRKANKIATMATSLNSSARYKSAIPNPKTGRWTDGEISFLVKSISLPRLEIAIMLNRSRESVSDKIRHLRKAGIIE